MSKLYLIDNGLWHKCPGMYDEYHCFYGRVGDYYICNTLGKGCDIKFPTFLAIGMRLNQHIIHIRLYSDPPYIDVSELYKDTSCPISGKVE